MALSWQHSSPIFGPNPAFRVNHIVITCFSSLLSSLLLVRPSLLHSLLPCFYYIFTYYYSIMSPFLLIITSVITQYLLIITSVITSVITSLLHIIAKSLLPIITVIMDPLSLIITRSIIGNNGSIITYYWPGQLGDELLLVCFLHSHGNRWLNLTPCVSCNSVWF